MSQVNSLFTSWSLDHTVYVVTVRSKQDETTRITYTYVRAYIITYTYVRISTVTYFYIKSYTVIVSTPYINISSFTITYICMYGRAIILHSINNHVNSNLVERCKNLTNIFNFQTIVSLPFLYVRTQAEGFWD